MHDSSQNNEAQEVSCDSLYENMSSENLLYEVIDEERSESKCARNMCILSIFVSTFFIDD